MSTVSAVFASAAHGGAAKEMPGEVPAREDVQQALSIVLRRAAEWNVDPRRVGLVGFSAGAITSLNVILASVHEAQPAFAGIIYGRMLSVTPPPAAPPLFVALAADDPIFGDEGFGLVQSWRGAGRPVEFHFYQSGDHGFGMKHQGTTSDHWIEEFYWWLEGDGILKSNQGAKSNGPPGI